MVTIREAIAKHIDDQHATLFLRHDLTDTISRERALDAFETFVESVIEILSDGQAPPPPWVYSSCD